MVSPSFPDIELVDFLAPEISEQTPSMCQVYILGISSGDHICHIAYSYAKCGSITPRFIDNLPTKSKLHPQAFGDPKSSKSVFWWIFSEMPREMLNRFPRCSNVFSYKNTIILVPMDFPIEIHRNTIILEPMVYHNIEIP